MKHWLSRIVILLLVILLPTVIYAVLIGDADNNGVVDGVDYTQWLTFFGQHVTNGQLSGDFSGNNTVGEEDYSLWLANYGITGPTTTPVRTPTVSRTPTIGISPIVTTPTPTINSSPPPAGNAVLISQQEIMSLPTSGTAWNNLVSWANQSIGTPTINNQDSDQDQVALAKAYTCARVNQHCDEVSSALNGLSSHAPSGDRTLAWGRNLTSWIIAADVVNNSGNGSGLNMSQMRTWAHTAIRTNSSEGETIITCHERRPNNWSTMCGGARMAADIISGDTADLDRAWNEYRGYMGDRSSGALYANTVVTTNWRCPGDSDRTFVNPKGCVKFGHNFDGILPAEMLRQGEYTSWPPPLGTVYPFNGLAGLVVQAEIAYKHGYPAYTVGDQAIYRAYYWLIDVAGFTAGQNGTSKAAWMPWILNKRYTHNWAVQSPATTGQNIGFVDWTHAH